MSALLESLLDFPRLADCAWHDAAAEHRPFCLTPKEDSMRHHLSASRAYAQLEATTPEPEGREFRITILRVGMTEQVVVRRCADALEANFEALRMAEGGGVPEVRPMVEMTEREGKDAYPRPLHRDAAADARIGWTRAAARHHLHLRDAALGSAA